MACEICEIGDGAKTTAQSTPIWAALSVLVPFPEKLPVTVLAEQSRATPLFADVGSLPTIVSVVGTRRSVVPLKTTSGSDILAITCPGKKILIICRGLS